MRANRELADRQGEHNRDLAREQAALTAAARLTEVAGRVMNDLLAADRMDGTVYDRRLTRYQAQRPFDVAVMVDGPALVDDEVIRAIASAQQALTQYLEWATVEDENFATVIEHVAGTRAPTELSQNGQPQEAIAALAEHMEYVEHPQVIVAFRQGAPIPGSPSLPGWPAHTPNQDP